MLGSFPRDNDNHLACVSPHNATAQPSGCTSAYASLTPPIRSACNAGLVLVRFYGEHSSMWVKEEELVALDMGDLTKLHDLRAWGRHHHKWESPHSCEGL